MMACYSVISVKLLNDDWLPSYLETVTGIIERYSGKYMARTASHQVLEGDEGGEQPDLRVILKWPSKEEALGFMNDPEYAPFLEARTAATISQHFIVEGVDDMGLQEVE